MEIAFCLSAGHAEGEMIQVCPDFAPDINDILCDMNEVSYSECIRWDK